MKEIREEVRLGGTKGLIDYSKPLEERVTWPGIKAKHLLAKTYTRSYRQLNVKTIIIQGEQTMPEPRWVTGKKLGQRLADGFIHCKDKNGRISRGYDANRSWLMEKADPKPPKPKKSSKNKRK